MKKSICLFLITLGLLTACAHNPPPITVVSSAPAIPTVDIRNIQLPSAIDTANGYTGPTVENLRTLVFWNTPISAHGGNWDQIVKMETFYYGNALTNSLADTPSTDLTGAATQVLSFSARPNTSLGIQQVKLLIALRERGFMIIDPAVFQSSVETLTDETLASRADLAVEVREMPRGELQGRVVRLNDGLIAAISSITNRKIPGSPESKTDLSTDKAIQKLCDDLTAQLIENQGQE